MERTGTIDGVLGKLWDLYIGNRIKDISVERYLLLLRNDKAEQIFSQEDVNQLLEVLRADKYEVEHYVAEPKPGEKKNGGV